MQSNSMPDHNVGPRDALRVLVVEDECLIRMLVSDHLRDAGFIVLEAFNGEEAIAILDAGAMCDLVFSDVRMPGRVDGLDLLAFVRRTQPGLPVLITSGHLPPDRAYAGGAAAFLDKPCDPEDVTRALRAAHKAVG